jgi:hypothetical protein
MKTTKKRGWMDDDEYLQRLADRLKANVYRQEKLAALQRLADRFIPVIDTPPMATTKIEVITSDDSGKIVSDAYRAAAFEQFNVETNFGTKITTSQTDYRTRKNGVTYHFRKDPINGDWYLFVDGIKYTRNRTLNLPHFEDALTIAVAAVHSNVSVVHSNFVKQYSIDVHVGDITFQFIMPTKFNEVSCFVLINCDVIPLPEIELTQKDYGDILYIELKNKLKIFWESCGLTFYAPPNQPIQILNPVVIKTTKDYNMSNYRLRNADKLLIEVLDSGNTNVALLLGKPGTGKTFFTDCYSKWVGAEYMYALCHDGTNAEDLFYSVNVGKAVLREGKVSEEIYQAGLLLRAVRASQKHKVVLCVDEIDKASKRTENLFLDFAETYRVPFLETQEVGVKENITLFFTSNGYRPHSEAFLRRCYRHHFDFLPRDVEISLIGGTYAEKIVDALAAIRKDGASSPSIKEGMLFAHNLQFANTKADVELLFFAHLCKEEEDFEVLRKGNFADKFVKPRYQKIDGYIKEPF